MICSRLGEYHQRGWIADSHIKRYLALNRDIELVPEEIRDYVMKDDVDVENKRPSSDFSATRQLEQSRIVIATWHMCGTLYMKELW